MSIAQEFIQDNFKTVSVLKNDNNGITELVIDYDKKIYIRKTIPHTNLPYPKLAKITHHFLPQIYYYVEAEKCTYVIEEYIKGRNLQEILDAEGPFSEEQVKSIALQMCDALGIIHSHHILHRDIKPSNIILQDDGSIKLIDFGSAKLISANKTQNTRDTQILGTPGYAPPEQYGFSRTDVRSDFYALGMTIKTLLGNEYHGSLLKVVAKCSQFDPQKRIASARELRKLIKDNGYKQKIIIISAIIIIISAAIAGYLYYSESTSTTKEPVQQENIEEQQKSNSIENNSPNEQKTIKQKTGPYTPNNKIAEPNKKSSPISPQQNTENIPAGNLVVTSQNWDTFSKSNQTVAGFTLLKSPSGNCPRIIINNQTAKPLHNVSINLKLTDFGVQGTGSFNTEQHHEKETWNGLEIWDISNKIAVDDINKGVYQNITVKLTADIPANDYYTLELFGGATSVFLLTGSFPSVNITVRADNVNDTVSNYNLILK